MTSIKQFLFIFLVPLVAYAQDFEGYVEYDISYVLKNEDVSLDLLKKNFGTKVRTYYKNGFYKEITNSSYWTYQLFRYNESNIYYKNENDDTLRVISTIDQNEQAFEYSLTKNAADVAGERCNKLIISDQYGRKIYYYTNKYSLDPSFYKNFTSSNKNKVVDIMKALYLKLVMEYKDFEVHIVCTKVVPETLKPDCFDIPKSKHIKIEKK